MRRAALAGLLVGCGLGALTGCGSDAVAPRAASRRYYPPTRWMLGPIYGTGCPSFGACERGPSMTDEVLFHLGQLTAHDIPITLYHFDGDAWASEPCTWGLGEAVVERLETMGVRALVHFWGGVPPTLGSSPGGCTSTSAFEAARAGLGPTFGGFYLDDGATEDLGKDAIDWVQATAPGDGEVVAKAFANDGQVTHSWLGAYAHTCYVNDHASDFAGLRDGIQGMLSLADTLPAPFSELTGYDAQARPDEETFFRRIHFGALQPVMDHSPWMNASPWRPEYGPALLEDYRYFAWLHKELVPYLHSYDYNAYETNEPILRDTDVSGLTTRLGEELFVAYVAERGVRSMAIRLPAGEWLDYWHPTRTYLGTKTIEYEVPLGHEPIFVRNGALLPLEVSRPYTGHGTARSEGSLTVVVYPSGTSTFRYRDSAAQRWTTLTASRVDSTLTLSASSKLSTPVLYRIENWAAAPATIDVQGDTVLVNQGGDTPRAESEDGVNGSDVAAWHFDRTARRLIVKAGF